MLSVWHEIIREGLFVYEPRQWETALQYNVGIMYTIHVFFFFFVSFGGGGGGGGGGLNTKPCSHLIGYTLYRIYNTTQCINNTKEYIYIYLGAHTLQWRYDLHPLWTCKSAINNSWWELFYKHIILYKKEFHVCLMNIHFGMISVIGRSNYISVISNSRRNAIGCWRVRNKDFKQISNTAY